MRSPDPTTEQAIAAARLKSITDPDHGEPTPTVKMPPTFQAFRAAMATQAPTNTGVRVLIAIGALATLLGALYLWQSTPATDPLPPPPATNTPPPTTPRPTASLTIHVTGKVRTPGVYTLPTGSRVTDALTAAGGLRTGANPGPLNLARRLIDGEQIAVGTRALAPGTTAALPADPATTVLDLNAATPAQLEQLPGVGEVLAARITAYRDTHGGFRSVDQLKEVTGIGPRTYDELKDHVRV